jgi:hypothetical protein
VLNSAFLANELPQQSAPAPPGLVLECGTKRIRIVAMAAIDRGLIVGGGIGGLGELYVLAQSRDRVAKERAMRRRQLKRLWARLKPLLTMALSREELLMKLGATRDQSQTRKTLTDSAPSERRPMPLARPAEFVVCPLMCQIQAFRYFWP